MKKRMLLLCAAVGLVVVTPQAFGLKRDNDYQLFINAIRNLDADKVEKVIEKQTSKDAEKNLVTTKTRWVIGDTPLMTAAKTYISKQKDYLNKQQAENGAAKIRKILALLLKKGANLYDLEEYANKKGNYYDPIIAEFYNSRVFDRRKR